MLHHYPKERRKWVSVFFEWAHVNVGMGLLPVVISIALIAFSNGPFKLPGDLALSLVVLTMTVAATGMDALKEYRAELGEDKAQWIRRGFTYLLIFGGLLSAVCTPNDLVRPEKINQFAIFLTCAALLCIVLPLGFVSHVLGLRSRDAELERVFRVAFDRFEKDHEFLQAQEDREQQLQEALAEDQGVYNGVRV